MPDTPGPDRPRRSVLYLPGANERALAKAATLPADALILDLEDAVAADAKAAARERVANAVASGDYGQREVAIRINGIGTRWHDEDLKVAAGVGPDAVLVPKVGSGEDVLRIERALVSAGAPESIAIWAMIETPRAILHAEEVATASDRLEVLVMGTNDLASELHAEHVAGRAPLAGALSLALLAARCAGRVILDGVYNDVGNIAGFSEECLAARRWGFDGKTLIHPKQIEPCNRAFAPSPDEIEHARRVVSAFREARAQGKGVVVVDGRMVEELHVLNAQRVLGMASAVGEVG